MVWVRFDDQFPIHRKVDGLSDAAFRLHVSAIFWCVRNLTDGLVPEEDLDIVSARVRSPQRFAAELVRRKLWCQTEDGWLIHDFLEFQPSRAEVLEKRAKRAAAGRKGGIRSGESRRGSGGSLSYTNQTRSNHEANASGLVHEPLNPVPSRPEGTRTDTGSQSSSRRNARAWANDDDSIDLGIVELLAELTGQEVTILDATKIRQAILDGRQVKNRSRYVAKAIEDNPSKFLPKAEAVEPNFDGSPLRVVPEWCGYCDAHDRTVELADGKVARCQQCNPHARDPFASREVS
jgi:hypothetical protein